MGFNEEMKEATCTFLLFFGFFILMGVLVL